MPTQPDSAREATLDVCIDLLIDGRDWSSELPRDASARAELTSLMEVASHLVRMGSLALSVQPAQKQRVWNRVEARSQPRTTRSRLKAIAFYRLPYLPALWIRPEAC